jgi:hypothetical protein
MTEHHLYVIAEGPSGPIKIGRSISAHNRLASLQTGNPRALQLVGYVLMTSTEVVEAERLLHEELSQYAMVGEWFDLSVEFISAYMRDFMLSHGFGVMA